ncbi:hypothetical protein TruAng_002039 [Truncatella angustata]|nr:hypothetical protein TruAng_002039 [Truncatella angustata]
MSRRRLRSSLPTSPVTSKPPPPREPDHWIWRCCQCHTTWDLAVTRRCLLCSHSFCSIYEPPFKRKNNKRRVRHGKLIICGTSFDFHGWNVYNAWRRSTEKAHLSDKQRDRRFLLKTHNDWLHCDYPSHCRHRREELLPSRLEILLEELDEEDENDKESCADTSRKSCTALSTDDELEMNEAIPLEPSDESDRVWWKDHVERPIFPTVNISNLSDERLLSLLEETHDLMPLGDSDRRQSSVRDKIEVNWEDFSDSDDSDDEDSLFQSALTADMNDDEDPSLLVKRVNSFWSSTDF